MPLTDAAIRNARPRKRNYQLADVGGLYLLFTLPGGKLWRLKILTDGWDKKLAIGSYPEIGPVMPASAGMRPESSWHLAKTRHAKSSATWSACA